MVHGTRDRALDAAIELLGTQGMHALTHRKVDAAAGLPAGSTSNWFRTRAALIQGVVERMVDVELPEVADLEPPRSIEELIDMVCGFYDFLVGPNRTATAGRLALTLEAGHDEHVRATLARGRSTFDSPVQSMFIAVGAPDPELATKLLAACLQGLYLQEIGGYAKADAHATIAAAVRASISPALL
jgi:AcrR family transcriptional regulator